MTRTKRGEGGSMARDEALMEFRAAGALLDGHFLLSSGLHSPAYLQCALALMDPFRAARLCGALAKRLRCWLEARDLDVDLCVSPAMGGVVAGYETARHLGVSSVFAERVEGKFAFRRGFAIPAGARCAIVEDVVTTGGSVASCAEATRMAGGDAVVAAALVDRSGGRANTSAPLVSLLELDIPAYPADAMPPALASLPLESPGSRHLSA